MKVLVTYDSWAGSNEMLARAAAQALEERGHQVHCEKVSSSTSQRARDVELIVICSPTHADRTTRKLRKFASALDVSGKKFLLLGSCMGFRAKRGAPTGTGHLAKILEGKGGKLITPPRVYAVKGLALWRKISADDLARARAFVASVDLE